MGMGRGRIIVPMPESEMYKQTVSRDQLVSRFGENTVSRAELSAVLNILYAVGMVRPHEFTDIMVRQCERIEEERRKAAGLQADRG